MKKRTTTKLVLTLSLLTIPSTTAFLCPNFLSALTAHAATIYSTTTDEQGVTYSINTSTKTAMATSYNGASGVAITIPDTLSYSGLTYPVTEIGPSAFANTGISSLVIGDNVTDIDTGAFQTTSAFPDFYKTALTSVVFGKNVESIKSDAFSGNALTSLQFPSALTKIASRAFANNLLIELDFGENLQEIYAKAFQSNNITKLTFAPTSSTLIDSAAFSGSPVNSISLGEQDSWAADALNKVSPLFTQLADLPSTGLRTISVNPDGSIYKSWLLPAEPDSAPIAPANSETPEVKPELQTSHITPKAPIKISVSADRNFASPTRYSVSADRKPESSQTHTRAILTSFPEKNAPHNLRKAAKISAPYSNSTGKIIKLKAAKKSEKSNSTPSFSTSISPQKLLTQAKTSTSSKSPTPKERKKAVKIQKKSSRKQTFLAAGPQQRKPLSKITTYLLSILLIPLALGLYAVHRSKKDEVAK